MLLFFFRYGDLMSILSIIIAVLPVILIGLFIYKNDKLKEPSGLLLKLFLGGVASCFPAVFLEKIISPLFPTEAQMNFIQMILYVFIAIAFVEELCKWFFVYMISYNNNEFDSLYDMIVYSSFVALGFACFENILYVSSSGILTGVVRAISAVPGHVCDGIFMGSYLALAKLNDEKGNYILSKKYKILSIVVPIIAHGIYDFCVFWDNPLFLLIFVVFVIIMFVTCFRKVKEVSMNDINFKYKNNYCTKCGLKVSTPYCTRCGNKNI